MDKPALKAAARRYIKHHVRVAVAPCLGNSSVLQEMLDSHGTDVERAWFEALGQLDTTDAETKDQLSRLVNEAFIEAIRDVRETVGDGPGIHQAISTFHATFHIDQMLPQVFA